MAADTEHPDDPGADRPTEPDPGVDPHEERTTPIPGSSPGDAARRRTAGAHADEGEGEDDGLEDPWDWDLDDDEDGGSDERADEAPAERAVPVGGARALLARALGGLSDRVGPDPEVVAPRSARTAEGACRRCGAHVGAADRFCASCGTSLRAGAPGAGRGGRVAPQALRLGAPALLAAAVVIVAALLLRDPLSGVRSDLGDALAQPIASSAALTRTLERLPADGDPAAAGRAAETLVSDARRAREDIDAFAAPPGAIGDVRRSVDALGAQSRWARSVLEALADPQAASRVDDRARAAQRSLAELEGLVDVGEATRSVGGTVELRRSAGRAGERRQAERRRRAAAARRISGIEQVLGDGAGRADEQRDGRSALARLARDEGEDEEGDGPDPEAPDVLQELRTTLPQVVSSREAAARRAADLDVEADLRPSRRALAAAYRAAGAEASQLLDCLNEQVAVAPAAAASTCRERTADRRAAASRARDAFVEAYRPRREAAGRSGRLRV